mmetsp:Transcript_15841/g.35252  ORF Transcript_15841/g.35252 Transcript_15841/m.35252 type:complete len:268 (+) Transcript_15841:159-962(+)
MCRHARSDSIRFMMCGGYHRLILAIILHLVTTAQTTPAYADFTPDYTLSQTLNGGFKCTTPAASSGNIYSSSTPFNLLQFCFTPHQSAFVYIEIDFGDGSTGQFGAQVTKDTEYCRPKSPKPILGGGNRTAYVEFDESRIWQAVISTGHDGCTVNQGGIPISQSTQAELIAKGSSLDSSSNGENKALGANKEDDDVKNQDEDIMLDFEVVPPSRYGETIMPVQAIIGLEEDAATSTKTSGSASISALANQAAMLGTIAILLSSGMFS